MADERVKINLDVSENLSKVFSSIRRDLKLTSSQMFEFSELLDKSKGNAEKLNAALTNAARSGRRNVSDLNAQLKQLAQFVGGISPASITSIGTEADKSGRRLDALVAKLKSVRSTTTSLRTTRNPNAGRFASVEEAANFLSTQQVQNPNRGAIVSALSFLAGSATTSASRQAFDKLTLKSATGAAGFDIGKEFQAPLRKLLAEQAQVSEELLNSIRARKTRRGKSTASGAVAEEFAIATEARVKASSEAAKIEARKAARRAKDLPTGILDRASFLSAELRDAGKLTKVRAAARAQELAASTSDITSFIAEADRNLDALRGGKTPQAFAAENQKIKRLLSRRLQGRDSNFAVPSTFLNPDTFVVERTQDLIANPIKKSIKDITQKLTTKGFTSQRDELRGRVLEPLKQFDTLVTKFGLDKLDPTFTKNVRDKLLFDQRAILGRIQQSASPGDLRKLQSQIKLGQVGRSSTGNKQILSAFTSGFLDENIDEILTASRRTKPLEKFNIEQRTKGEQLRALAAARDERARALTTKKEETELLGKQEAAQQRSLRRAAARNLRGQIRNRVSTTGLLGRLNTIGAQTRGIGQGLNVLGLGGGFLSRLNNAVGAFRVFKEASTTALAPFGKLAKGAFSIASQAAGGFFTLVRAALPTFTILGAAGAFAFGKLAASIIKTTGEYELYRTQLRAIIKDVNEADIEFESLREEAVRSPLGAKEFVESFVRLRAVGVPAARETVKALSDVAITFNRDLKDVASAFIGVETEVLRRLGVLLIRSGTRAFVQSQGEIQVVNNDIVSIRAALLDLLQRNLPDAATQVRATLVGKFREFRSLLDEVAFDIGKAFLPGLKSILDSLISFVNSARPVLQRFILIARTDFEGLSTVVSTFFSQSFDALVGKTSQSKAFFTKLATDLGDIFSNIVEATLSAFALGFRGIGEIVRVSIVGAFDLALQKIEKRFADANLGENNAPPVEFANFVAGRKSPLADFLDDRGAGLSIDEIQALLKGRKRIAGIDIDQAKVINQQLNRAQQDEAIARFTLETRIREDKFRALIEAGRGAEALALPSVKRPELRDRSRFTLSSFVAAFGRKGGDVNTSPRLPLGLSSTIENAKIANNRKLFNEDRELIRRTILREVAGADSRLSTTGSELERATQALLEQVRRDVPATFAAVSNSLKKGQEILVDTTSFVRTTTEDAQKNFVDSFNLLGERAFSTALSKGIKEGTKVNSGGRSLEFENRDIVLQRLREIQNVGVLTKEQAREVVLLKSALGIKDDKEAEPTPIERNKAVLRALEAKGVRFVQPLANAPVATRRLAQDPELQQILKNFLTEFNNGEFFFTGITKKNSANEAFQQLTQSFDIDENARLFGQKLIDFVVKTRDNTFRFGSENLNRINAQQGGNLLQELDARVAEILRDSTKLQENFSLAVRQGGFDNLRREVASSESFTAFTNPLELQAALSRFALPKGITNALGGRDSVESKAFIDRFSQFLDRDNASFFDPVAFQSRIRDLQKEFGAFVNSLSKSDPVIVKILTKVGRTIPEELKDSFVKASEEYDNLFRILQPEAVLSEALGGFNDQQREVYRELQSFVRDTSIGGLLSQFKELSLISEDVRTKVRAILATSIEIEAEEDQRTFLENAIKPFLPLIAKPELGRRRILQGPEPLTLPTDPFVALKLPKSLTDDLTQAERKLFDELIERFKLGVLDKLNEDPLGAGELLKRLNDVAIDEINALSKETLVIQAVIDRILSDLPEGFRETFRKAAEELTNVEILTSPNSILSKGIESLNEQQAELFRSFEAVSKKTSLAPLIEQFKEIAQFSEEARSKVKAIFDETAKLKSDGERKNFLEKSLQPLLPLLADNGPRSLIGPEPLTLPTDIFSGFKVPRAIRNRFVGPNASLLEGFIDRFKTNITNFTTTKPALAGDLVKRINPEFETQLNALSKDDPLIKPTIDKQLLKIPEAFRDSFRAGLDALSNYEILTNPGSVLSENLERLNEQTRTLLEESIRIKNLQDGGAKTSTNLGRLSSKVGNSPTGLAEQQKIVDAASVASKNGNPDLANAILDQGITNVQSGTTAIAIALENGIESLKEPSGKFFAAFVEGFVGGFGAVIAGLIKDLFAFIQDFFNQVGQLLENRLADVFEKAIVDGKSFKKEFIAQFKGIEKEILRIFARLLASLVVTTALRFTGAILGTISGALGGPGGGGGALPSGGDGAGLSSVGNVANAAVAAGGGGGGSAVGSVIGGAIGGITTGGVGAAAGASLGGAFGKKFGMASGGIVVSPTSAIIGEGGPEAVVPLDGGRLPVVFNESVRPPAPSQTIVYNINAIDSRSFEEAVNRNGIAVSNAVIRGNRRRGRR